MELKDYMVCNIDTTNKIKELFKNKPLIIAGPCAVNTKEELIENAKVLKSIGVNVLRGGAFKPRTSPYSFQGMEEIGLDYLVEAKKETGLPIITEITSLKYLEKYINDIDIIQVGSRNMYNYELLKELGKTDKIVMLKRGMTATIEELLSAAEYIVKGGNHNVILCERGIRSFDNETRNVLDIQAVPVLKKYTKLPIIIDPSHAAGRRDIIEDMALASIVAKADGLIIEAMIDPDSSICDSKQTISTSTLKDIIDKINIMKQNNII